MDKYEQAIAYFEDAIKESDEIIADCSPDLQAELTEQKGHFVVALEVLREPSTLYVRVKPCHNLPESLKQLRGKCCTYGDISFDKFQHIQEKIGIGAKEQGLEGAR